MSIKQSGPNPDIKLNLTIILLPKGDKLSLPDEVKVPGVIVTDVSEGTVFGSYGTININKNWQKINLEHSFTDPVVIVGDPTRNETDPGTVRLRNINSTSFEIRFQEPNHLSQDHAAEQVSYLVAESGEWQLNDGTKIQVGKVNSNKLSSKGFETVSFSESFSNTPAVLTQIQTFAGADYAITRTDKITGEQFKLTMQEEERNNDGGHAKERIGWLAIDSGIGNDGDTVFEAGITGNIFSHNVGSKSFSESFSEIPALIAKMSSYRGADPGNLRITELTTDGFKGLVSEDQSRDNELRHGAEAVSYLALAGSDNALTGLII